MVQVKSVPALEGEPDNRLSVEIHPVSDIAVECGSPLYERALSGLLKQELYGAERAIGKAINDCFDGFDSVEDAAVRLRTLTGLIEGFRLNLGNLNRSRQQKEH